MKAALILLLTCSLLWAQAPPKSSAAPVPALSAPSPDALTELLAQVQAAAQKSDGDLDRLRIDRWKTDAAGKQEAQSIADSIHRNLVNAVPELLQRVQSQPTSLAANFRLYRNFNALYDTFSALVESAGAFGPAAQYTPLADDAAQLDQLRRQLADRVDLFAGSSDAELIRLRAQSAAAAAAATAKPVPKIVVDDNKPVVRKKKKPKNPPPPPQP